jgi:hypothetical protein
MAPSENSTTEKDYESTDLLAVYGEQIQRCLDKADELDRMKNETPETVEYVDMHRRLTIKAGVWRSVAHDMKNTLKIHFANAKHTDGHP